MEIRPLDHNGFCSCITCVSPAAAVAADLARRGETVAVAPGEDECRCEMCRLTSPVEAGEYRCHQCHDIGLRSDAHRRGALLYCARCLDCCGECDADGEACICRVTDAPDGERGCKTHGARV